MAILKCKMCGGTLEITEGQTVCECEYCGTNQTVTTAKDENLQALFNRANILRMKSEFDKAENLYEKLIQSSPDDPEAHWGLILCKFGIEYVEDPKTYKRIPTCHRTSFDSIISDEDYREALRCADPIQRELYESEAKEIDRIQKEILALSAKEEPYDVFICYKETDEKGSRTPDSVIANDIYYQLTNEGFKVFYSAITLEDKLGSAYEPCIFAALNSAKVMLAVGTKPEHFNAVWVKNEWSRFLKMMKKDRSKMLIPCYKNMDAYELPEEFAHLQAQDMGKIGFINDIVRGIKKVIAKDRPKSDVMQTNTQVQPGNATVNSLLKRVFIFLEDGNLQSANEYCEKVLDIDPENGRAYLGKLMVELEVNNEEDLQKQPKPFSDSNNYQKIMRYGDEKLKTDMERYIQIINNEIIYKDASSILKHAAILKDFKKAEEMFEKIQTYKDSETIIKKCEDVIHSITQKKEEVYQQANELTEQKNYYEAIKKLAAIIEYKDCGEKAEYCAKKHNQQRKEFEAKLDDLRNEKKTLNKKLGLLYKNIQEYDSNQEKLKNLREEQAALVSKNLELNNELSGLAFFAVPRKMEIKAEIKSNSLKISEIPNQIAALEDESYGADSAKNDQTELDKIQIQIQDIQKSIHEIQLIITKQNEQLLSKKTEIELKVTDYGILVDPVLFLSEDSLSISKDELRNYINNHSILSVIIPDSVTDTEKSEFKRALNISKKTQDSRAINIGKSEFVNSKKTNNITIPINL